VAITLQDTFPIAARQTRRRTLAGHLIRAVVFVALAAFLLIVLTPRETGFDGPMHLAARLWHGELGFPAKDAASWWETFQRGDRTYLVYAPMASVLLMPYVAAGGEKLGMPVANTLFLLASTVVLWFLMRSDRRLRRSADVAAAAYLLGTP